MKQPNVDFLMNMTKAYLDGKIDSVIIAWIFLMSWSSAIGSYTVRMTIIVS